MASPMLQLAVYAPVDEPLLRTWVRRLALLASTWLMAHIYNLLCEIMGAVDVNLKEDDEPSGNGAAADGGGGNTLPEAAVNGPSAAGPAASSPSLRARRNSRAERPTLQAGFSTQHVPAGTRTTHAWADLSAENFRVRCGPNYKWNGFKAPSGPALGTVVACDVFRSERKIFNFVALNHVALPEPTPGWSEAYPEIVVINQMVPVEFHNSLMTSESTDGETLHLVTYVRVKPNLAPGYQTDQEPADAEQLLKRCAAAAACARRPRVRAPPARSRRRRRAVSSRRPPTHPVCALCTCQLPPARRPGPRRRALLQADWRRSQLGGDGGALAQEPRRALPQIQRQADPHTAGALFSPRPARATPGHRLGRASV